MNENDMFPVEMVQFNKRVTREVSDGYELLAIKTRRKVPALLAEGLALLLEKYSAIIKK